MSRRGFRFHPPEMADRPELRWVLLCGFGPPDKRFPGSVEPEKVSNLAGAFALKERIGSRIRQELLRTELGAETARDFVISSACSEAQAERVMRTAHEVAGLAVDARVSLVFLKFAALYFCGAVRAGSRAVADLDVMVAPEHTERFAEVLQSRGFEMSGVPDSDQHLAPFVRDRGDVVEVHRYLQGVRLSRTGAFATVAELAASNLLIPVPGFPGVCSMPDREILAAHLIAHGIAHHGLKPQEYPLFRMIGDLIDLGFASNDGAATLERITPWLEREVGPEEAQAVRDLCVGLMASDETLFAEAACARPEVLLLRHLVAGGTDQEYVRSLQVRAFLGRVSHLPRPLAVARALWHALFLNRSQVDKIYGAQDSRLGYLRLQVVRPFDVLVQATRSLATRVLTVSRRKT